jgi:hypothetical protein
MAGAVKHGVEGIPQGIAAIDQAGLDVLMQRGAADPALAQRVVDAFERDPKGLVTHLFRLNPAQAEAIAKMNDAQLKELGQPLVDAVSKHHYSGWKMDYPGGHNRFERDLKAECSCKIQTN